jgi:hypothetical protein
VGSRTITTVVATADTTRCADNGRPGAEARGDHQGRAVIHEITVAETIVRVVASACW